MVSKNSHARSAMRIEEQDLQAASIILGQFIVVD